MVATAAVFSATLASATCDSYLLTGTSPSSVLSIEAINDILTEHNNARRNVDPVAATMPMLVWDYGRLLPASRRPRCQWLR